MVKVASWTLLVLLAVCGVAHGADAQKHASKLSQWSSVEALPQTTPIEVLTEHQAGPDSCRISSVDDNSLTCSPEGAESDARLGICGWLSRRTTGISGSAWRSGLRWVRCCAGAVGLDHC
jgi:hypothetical protein